jgi:PAS domain S-box-containing protein
MRMAASDEDEILRDRQGRAHRAALCPSTDLAPIRIDCAAAPVEESRPRPDQMRQTYVCRGLRTGQNCASFLERSYRTFRFSADGIAVSDQDELPPIVKRPPAPSLAPGSDQLFRLLVEGVTDYAIFLLDTGGRITTWNAGAERIKGYKASEIIGSHFSRFYTEEDLVAGMPERALCTAAETGRFETEGWRVRKDGSRFRANVVIDAIRDPHGELIAFAKVTRDISERVEAQTALRESEERFRILVQGVTDYAIYMLDPQGRISNWNLGGERIKGYTADEIVGRHFSIFFTPGDRARGEPEREIATATREGRFEGEGWRVRKDGTVFWAGVVVDRILDQSGNLLGFAKITRDMTEKKKAAEELERARAALAQAQKMEAIGQLTGGIAHDFNNLLTVITNSLDLLLDSRRDETQRRRIIETAQRAAERGARLNQQLLAFSRRQPLRPEPHDINALIGGFETVLRRACREAIAFDLDLAPVPVGARIDAQQFETALLNLVVNARDAMPGGGSIRIATRIETIDETRARAMSDIKPGRYVEVSVSDTGQGMSPEIISRAFEPFFTTKEVGKGSGLGLSQVYGFVAQSGGHVAIDSAPGAGTTVTLFLPASEGDRPADPAYPEAQAKTMTERILVVEDDPDVLDVAVESLRLLGYEVLTAPDAPSALAVLRREPDIRILLSDIVMPHGMNGVELAREAVRLRPGLRVLLASGYPMSVQPQDDGRPVLDEFPFLPKPYRSSQLAAALRAL